MIVRNAGRPGGEKGNGDDAAAGGGRGGDPDGSLREESAPSRRQWLWPLIVLGISLFIALRWQVLGRGADMYLAYPSALLLQVVFGLLALWAAIGVLSERNDGPLLNALRIAAMFAAYDAVRTFVDAQPLAAIIVAAVVHIALAIGFFRMRMAHVIFIASILFLIKTIGAQMTEATWFTWFE